MQAVQTAVHLGAGRATALLCQCGQKTRLPQGAEVCPAQVTDGLFGPSQHSRRGRRGAPGSECSEPGHAAHVRPAETPGVLGRRESHQ